MVSDDFLKPTYVSHFFPHELNGFKMFEVYLWILIYDSGVLFSWNHSDVYDNYVLMSEIGGIGYFTYHRVFVDEKHLPNVFKSCLHRQSEQALHKESLF